MIRATSPGNCTGSLGGWSAMTLALQRSLTDLRGIGLSHSRQGGMPPCLHKDTTTARYKGRSPFAGVPGGVPLGFVCFFPGWVGGTDHAHVPATTPTPPIAPNASPRKLRDLSLRTAHSPRPCSGDNADAAQRAQRAQRFRRVICPPACRTGKSDEGRLGSATSSSPNHLRP